MTDLKQTFDEAVALQRRGELTAAIGHYRTILEQAPGLMIARDNLALALLASGDYAEGFPLYDVRFDREPPRQVQRPGLTFPEWKGEPLAGRSILIWMEQGFGDQIMYARFVRTLVNAGAKVSILAPRELARLFELLPAEVIRAEGSVKIPDHDFWIMPGSLPGRLGVTLATLPAAPYLQVDARPTSTFGVFWKGRTTPDPYRSLPDDLGAELLASRGARSLQPEDNGARDFRDTAQIIAGLDHVITIDSAVAHLAGAMGKPTTILLPYLPDWRWMWGRADTPWYPNSRLLRQPAPQDWGTVVRKLKAEMPGLSSSASG